MKKYAFLMLLILTAGVFQSCQKDEIVEPGEKVAPELPKQEMFVMPFEAFNDLDTNGLVREEPLTKDNNSFHNWFHSAVNVFVWNTAIAVNTVLPTIAFYESFNHQPIYAGNGVFQWIYDVQSAGDTYFIVLSGQFVNGTDVQWEMKASKLGGFSNVTWYTGIVSGDGSGATWTLNHKPNSPEPYISIDYQKDPTSGNASIRYTNIIPGDDGNGDYIEYRVDSNAAFNRAYDVYGGNTTDFIEIRWNEPTNEGQVKHPAHFGDTDWHCWDISLMDVGC